MAEKVAIFGGGSWGTAMAIHLAGQGYDVYAWDIEAERAHLVQRERFNGTYLPGIHLPDNVFFTGDIQKLAGAVMQLLAVPTQYVRSFLHQYGSALDSNTPLVSLSKGIEQRSFYRVSQIVEESLPGKPYLVLSGPSHAEEVARGIPSALVAASTDEAVRERAINMLKSATFRPYASDDVVGVETGGALKNIMAIATGVADGIGFGDNTRAAIITRGLEEMRRIGVRLGGRSETFMGLSGIGDLVVTCSSDHSRNRRVGLALGKGKKLEQILHSMQMVAEGVETTRSVYEFCQREGLEAPITGAVYNILYENGDPRERLTDLMMRSVKEEQYD